MTHSLPPEPLYSLWVHLAIVLVALGCFAWPIVRRWLIMALVFVIVVCLRLDMPPSER